MKIVVPTAAAQSIRGGGVLPPQAVSPKDVNSQWEDKRPFKRVIDDSKTEAVAKESLVDLFVEQVARTPKQEALIWGEQRLTYSQLFARATAIAQKLGSLEVGNEELVGVCLERSWEMVTAILGTLQAGAAYVPLDPKYPAERLAFMLEDSQLKVLLTQRRLLGALPKTSARIVCVEDLNLEQADATGLPQEAGTACPGPKPDHLAYVLYTSGSTGRPKGVAVEHRSVVALMHWARQQFTPEELSGVLGATSICFDVSVFELFAPLCWGGRLILAKDTLELPALPAAGEVRLAAMVPSVLSELLRAKGIPPTLQVLNLAGEPLSAALADEAYRETKVKKVYDLYGPTETTVYSTCALRVPGGPASIGQALPGEQAYVLDSELRPLGPGAEGGLYLGGCGLARGYLNQPGLTAERFISAPDRPGSRLYQTGDLARWRADGNLEYLGRADQQVKIRGYRIELGEIEAVLRETPGVESAVVAAREDTPGDKRLVAYWQSAEQPGPEPEELRKTARARLPAYMIPAHFVRLQSIPRTPSGKIARQALPPPPRNQRPPGPLQRPRNNVEEQLTRLWNEVLDLEEAGVSDNFFALGGHSLLAIRLLGRIRDLFAVELPMSAVFETPTIAELAKAVMAEQGLAKPAGASALQLPPRPEHLPLSFVQERLWFLDQLQPDLCAYNVASALRLTGSLDEDALKRAYQQLIASHEVLRTTLQSQEGQLRQVIASAGSSELEAADISHANNGITIDGVLRERMNAEAQRPFNLERGPLIRARLFRLGREDHALLVVMHHTISDGWSMEILFKQLAALYHHGLQPSQTAAPFPLQIQYADFALWQRQRLQGDHLSRELEFWKQALAGAPTSLPLPTDHAEPNAPSGRASAHALQLREPLVAKVHQACRAQGLTPFLLMLSALAVLLYKWTSQKDLVIGTVAGGRDRREFEPLIGCLINFLPIRIQLGGRDSLKQVVARVRAAVLNAQAHQECPFEKIVETINPERRLNQNPLYNVALVSQSLPDAPFPSRQIESRLLDVEMSGALLDLHFDAEQTSSGLRLKCAYRADQFERSTIEQLLSGFSSTLETLLASPELELDALPLAGGLAQQAAAAQARESRPLLAFASTFTAEPIAEALRYWLRELDLAARFEFAPYNQVFQQLLDPASLLARNAKGLNIILLRWEDWQEPGRGEDTKMAEFIAALKSAAARDPVPYLVCLCPPSKRVLADGAGAALQASHEQALGAELETLAGVHWLSPQQLALWYPVSEYDDPQGEELGHVPYTPLFFTALATAIARKFHLLNRPISKAIVLDCDHTLWAGICGEEGAAGVRLDASRRALQEFMCAQQKAGRLLCLCSKNNEEDVREVFSQRREMPLQWEHLTAWRLNWKPKSENLKSLAQELQIGLDSLVFLDDNPLECAEVEANCPEALTLQLPEDPAQIPQFLNHCWPLDQLKLTVEDAHRGEWYRQNRQRESLRAQSPSLADFLASLDLQVRIEPLEARHLTRVSQLSLRTNQFNFTTRRLTEGELQQMLQRNTALTVSVQDRFGDYGLVGVAIYRARGHSLEVDTFLLSCRVLGRGVEHRLLSHLGEIAREQGLRWVEAPFIRTQKNKPALEFLESVGARFQEPFEGGCVFRFPAVYAAKVNFTPQAPPSGRPKATERPAPAPAPVPGARALSFARCRALALEAADPERIQARIEACAAVQPRPRSRYEAPRTQCEHWLCELWQRLLRVPNVGIQDNFFELGGHSLLAVRLFAEIQKHTGRKLPLVTIFQASCIQELAPLLSAHADHHPGSLLVPIQPEGKKPPLFLIHGAGGDVLWGYANLVKHLSPHQPVYGIKSRGQVGLQEPTEVKTMAECYVREVRTQQPRGPYYLGGYCFGGNVAYEMARQLESQGESVALVALLDSAPANAGYETVTWWQPAFAFRFARNLLYWLDDFDHLGIREQWRFIRRKSRALARRIKRRLGFSKASGTVDVEAVVDPIYFPESELKLWQIHLQALGNHIEQPHGGRVLLLRTRGQPLLCSFAPDFCWSKLLRNGITVRHIPGSHESIFTEPHVRALAHELQTQLNLAQAGASPDVEPACLLTSAPQLSSLVHPQ